MHACALFGAAGRTSAVGAQRKQVEQRESTGALASVCLQARDELSPAEAAARSGHGGANRNDAQRWGVERPVVILPQVHLRKPCYDFSFL